MPRCALRASTTRRVPVECTRRPIARSVRLNRGDSTAHLAENGTWPGWAGQPKGTERNTGRVAKTQ